MTTPTDLSALKHEASMQSASSLLALLHISSSSLPVGAFAYSQGLEYALDSDWCRNREEVEGWITDNLRFGLGQLDLPIYARLYRAWQTIGQEPSAVINEPSAVAKESSTTTGEPSAVINTPSATAKKPSAHAQELLCFWNESLLAYRETKELYLEDIQVGSAYAQWHLGQGAERQVYLDLCPQPTVVVMSALAAVLTNIDLPQALLGFAWGWAENQIACASKAMPMGQTDGQRILQGLIPLLAEVCDQALLLGDDQIGTSLLGSALASSLHEQQYSRLFRS